MSIEFKKASAADAEVITGLRKRIWADVYRGVYPDEAIDGYDRAYHLARDSARISSADMHVFLIEDDGRPIGYMYFEDKGCVHIGSLYLLREYRGRGLGREAFALVKKYCSEHGFSSLTFNCSAHNAPALGFYQHLGAVETGRDVGHENPQEDQVTFEFEV